MELGRADGAAFKDIHVSPGVRLADLNAAGHGSMRATSISSFIWQQPPVLYTITSGV